MNKRSCYRLPRSLLVKIDSQQGQCVGYVNDLAKSGVGIFCNCDFPVHAAVSVSIGLSKLPDFVLKGKIVWRRELAVTSRTKFQYGIRLAGDLTAYREFLSTQIRHDFELRRHPRYPDVLVVNNGDVIDLIDTAVTNVSAGGLYIRTNRALAVGDEIELELKNDRLVEPIFCLGEVVDTYEADADAFQQEYGAGFKISVFRGDGQARFGEYLKGLETLYSLYWNPETSAADETPASLRE